MKRQASREQGACCTAQGVALAGETCTALLAGTFPMEVLAAEVASSQLQQC